MDRETRSSRASSLRVERRWCCSSYFLSMIVITCGGVTPACIHNLPVVRLKLLHFQYETIDHRPGNSNPSVAFDLCENTIQIVHWVSPLFMRFLPAGDESLGPVERTQPHASYPLPP